MEGRDAQGIGGMTCPNKWPEHDQELLRQLYGAPVVDLAAERRKKWLAENTRPIPPPAAPNGPKAA